jgi:Bbp16-like protein
MLDGAYGIFDGTLNPTAGAAITASRTSANVIDLLAGRDIGAGIAYDQELHMDVLQAFVGATSLQASIQGSADNTTFYDMLFSPVWATAALVPGVGIFRYAVPVVQLNLPYAAPPGQSTIPRYLRLNYTVVGGPFTGGTILAYLNVDREERLIYKNNYVAA